MSARSWLILAGITGVLGVRPALAGSIPLPRGQFAYTLSGSNAICLNPSTFAEESCSTTGVLVVPITSLGNGVVTWDKNHSCASTVETDVNFPPDTFPPFLAPHEHIVRTVTTYDSSTGTGDESFTAYTGGKCNGASFDRTGATKFANGTDHFVVSEQGKRIDFELTTLTDPSHANGGFSLSGVNRAQ